MPDGQVRGSGLRSSLIGAGRRLFRPMRVGRLELPGPGLVVLAAIGAALLVTVATTRWMGLQDEHAYWLAAQRLVAGQPLYDPTADPATPYAYWYPPPLAQVLAPFTLVLPDLAFSLIWTALLLACLFYLSDRRLLVALAMVAFVPIAVELWFRNVHLLIAALAVIALRRWPVAWVAATAIKITPVIGAAYLLAARRYRDALLVAGVGMGVLAVSVLLSPGAWSQFIDVVVVRGGSSGASLVAVPFPVRFVVALALAVVGGRIGGRRGETLLILGLLAGNPTLYFTSFSLLAALVPIWWRPVSSGAPAMPVQRPAPA
jgi:hypothetical protein